MHIILAMSGHKISLPKRLIGALSVYSRGATMVFPAISIGTGCVKGTICIFPEKPTVLMDVLERGSFEPVFPIHE